MSHLVASKISISDLDLLKKTIAGFGGLEFKENQKKFKWYYGEKEAREQFGECEHAIKINGCTYEIGVFKNNDGPGWKLVFDPYDSKAAEIVGRNCEKVMCAYAETYIRDHAEKNGFLLEQTTDDEGNLCIVMTPGM